MLKLVSIYDLSSKSMLDYVKDLDNRSDKNTINETDDMKKYKDLLTHQIEEEPLIFYLVNDPRNKYIIGHCIISLDQLNTLRSGNVNVVIRNSERNKGFEYYLLELALDKCHEIGLESASLECLDYDETPELCFQKAGATFKGFCSDESLGQIRGSLCKVLYTINLNQRKNKTYNALAGSSILKLLKMFGNKR